MLPIELLQKEAAVFGVEFSPAQLQQFNTYCNFLLEYNEKVNLTAITDPAEVAVKHFVDSVAPLKFVKIENGEKLVDVGTGAGFPGVPLKIALPELQLSLMDSLNKRLLFLQQLNEQLGISAELLHFRAEQAGAEPALRAKFDITTARAVAQLSVLCEYNLPLLKAGGRMLVMKGPDCAQEIAAAKSALFLLGGAVEDVFEYSVGESRRTLIVVRKVSGTPKKYPRQRVKITQKPL